MNRTGLLTAVATCISVFFSAAILADEPAERFLEALRERGYYDIAIDYLEQIEDSPLVSPAFKKLVPFEKAETLIQSTTQLRDVTVWEQRLDEAEQLLTQFAASAETTEVVARAQRYRGNLKYRRARVYMKRAESERLTANEKKALMATARKHLTDSLADFSNAKESLKGVLANFQIDPDDKSTEQELRRLRTTYTQILIRTPLITEQLADTYEAEDPERKKHLQSAIDDYTNLWDKYYKYAAGLDSCLFAARCHYKLSQYDDALSLLQEIFNLSDTSALRVLRRKAMVLATDCWKEKEPYPYDQVIAQLEPTVNVLSRVEARQLDWLKIQFELARAYRAKAAQLSKEKQTGNAGRAKNFNRSAVKLVRNISRVPGPLRDQARNLLTEWNLAVQELETEEKTPETFVDARHKGRDHASEAEVILAEVAQLRIKLAHADSDEHRQQFQTDLDDANQRLEAQVAAALKAFDLALELADENTLREDINNVRYLQSFCYFATQQYFEAALIGEFLLERYPGVNWTRQAAGIVVKSYSKLYDLARGQDKNYERQRLSQVCGTIVKRWPGSAESAAAAATMTRLALSQKDFETAEKFFTSIPASSQEHATISIRMGQKLWFDYKDKKKLQQQEPNKYTDEQLAQQLAKAKHHLEHGINATDPDSITYDTALGSLLLVDAHLQLDETDAAVTRLEESSVAPLDLIKQKHPAITNSTARDLFVRETYKTAVKAYLASMSKSGNHQKWIEKAHAVIEAMRQDTHERDDTEGKKHIVTIYRLIANELKDQFDQLQRGDEQQAFASSIARFLESIEQESTDAKTILWAGTTLMGVATALNEQGLEEPARPLYKQAITALDRAEKLGFAGDSQADRLQQELKRQRALAERGAGNYEAALEQFVEILRESPTNLTVQVDAAHTLQMSGKAAKRPKAYAQAMMGIEPVKDPKTRRRSNLVWGWRRLVQQTRGKPKFSSTFYRSLYHLIESRFEYGKLEKSEKAIASALKELRNARARDAELGGSQWKAKFEALEKRIIKASTGPNQ